VCDKERECACVRDKVVQGGREPQAQYEAGRDAVKCAV
jgi:hypothetical protein